VDGPGANALQVALMLLFLIAGPVSVALAPVVGG